MESRARIPTEPGSTPTELCHAVAVGETLHSGRAAAACHVSPPTLSAGLRKLGDALGFQLFERSGKPVWTAQEGALPESVEMGQRGGRSWVSERALDGRAAGAGCS